MSPKTPVQQLHELAQGNFPSIKDISFIDSGSEDYGSAKSWKVELTATIIIRPRPDLSSFQEAEERTTLQGIAPSIKAAKQTVAKDMLDLIWQRQQERERFTRDEVVGKGLLVEIVEVKPRGVVETRTAYMQRLCELESLREWSLKRV